MVAHLNYIDTIKPIYSECKLISFSEAPDVLSCYIILCHFHKGCGCSEHMAKTKIQKLQKRSKAAAPSASAEPSAGGEHARTEVRFHFIHAIAILCCASGIWGKITVSVLLEKCQWT